MSEEAPRVAAPAVTPAPTPTAPSAVAPAMPPPLPMASQARPEREVALPRSSNPGPLLAIGAVVIFAAIIGIIFLVMRPKPSNQQTATTPPPSAQTPEAKTKPAPPPAKTSKVT